MTKSRAARQSAPPSAPPSSGRPSTAEIFQQNGPYAWRVLRRLGVAEADVDDVCQEVFVTVHRRLPEFEGRSSIRTWVYGICVRTAADYRKRVRARPEVVSEAAHDLATGPDQEKELSLRQARDALDNMLDQLDDDKRAAFVLYEIEELPMAEVALILRCPLQTAYSRLHSARREIEAALTRLRAIERGREERRAR